MPTPERPDLGGAEPDAAERDAAERLNRIWDALPRGGEDGRDGNVHPGGRTAPWSDDPVAALGEAVRLLHARDDAPAPVPTYAARLWRDLLSPAGTAPATEAAPVAAGPRSLAFLHPGARRSVLEVVAAALFLAVLGGSAGGGGFLPGLRSDSPTVAARDAAATPPGRACPASPTPALAATPPAATPAVDGCR